MRKWLTPIPILLWLSFLTKLTNASSSSSSSSSRKLVLGVDGGTESIRACFFDGETGEVVGKSCAAQYETLHPKPAWAEQRPDDWYECLGIAVRGAVESLSDENDDGYDASFYDICCMCIDTTCCSVVALDERKRPLRNCLLWMDQRSAPQTKKIFDICRGDPALDVNCGGDGPLSAEWMTPKALWIKENEPSIWNQATTICEYQDFLNFKLTGNLVASSCNAASRWHWNGDECIHAATPDNPFPGRPMSLYQKLEIEELAEKLPQRCLSMGDLVGHLTEEAGRHLGLKPGIPVAQGGPDAFVGMVGLGCIRPGQLALITGSSHLHCIVSNRSTTAPGTWGAYKGAPLKGLNFAEGGQSSTGSILRWGRSLLGVDDISYKDLDAEASQIHPGSDGLVALETFQGSRTPVTDPLARGALVGLTLSHKRAHVWRSLLESVCYGTRACIEALSRAGHETKDIVMAGGSTRSDLWLQMHADITGKDVIVCKFADAPLLGCAILASVNAGIHQSFEDAVASMVQQDRRIKPNDDTVKIYDELYHKTYAGLGGALSKLRGGDSSTSIDNELKKKECTRIPVISPSLLAADWADMRVEIGRCLDAGSKRLHIDIFDGVFLDSPEALTFGPQMVRSIRKHTPEHVVLDLHVCVDRPARYVESLRAAAGEAAAFIFQREAAKSIDEAFDIIRKVLQAGMKCGISINPSTSLDEIIPLLESGLVDVVDVLSVEPGFGGQSFQLHTIKKLERLVEYRETLQQQSGTDAFQIMVDGGISKETADKIKHTKPDILVSGSFLFNHKQSLAAGVSDIESSYR